MKTSLSKLRSIRALIAVAVFSVVVMGAVAFSPSQPSCSALPCHMVEHYYYSDATYGTQVGYKFVHCGGVTTWGQVTQYVFTVDGDCCPSCCGR